jgi:hypothetical protein
MQLLYFPNLEIGRQIPVDFQYLRVSVLLRVVSPHHPLEMASVRLFFVSPTVHMSVRRRTYARLDSEFAVTRLLLLRGKTESDNVIIRTCALDDASDRCHNQNRTVLLVSFVSHSCGVADHFDRSLLTSSIEVKTEKRENKCSSQYQKLLLTNRTKTMKVSTTIIFASMAATAQAFVQPSATASSPALRMSEDSAEPTPETLLPSMSQSLPFMERPAALDGSLVGDVGFDPFGFAKNPEDLLNYREAEIKHSRLAMLAAAGWPLSELFDAKIANTLGLHPIIDAGDRAPSVLNGGLGQISTVYWLACLGGAAAIEFIGFNQNKKSGYTPGSFGFDPLGLYPEDEAGKERMQLAELKNGRLSMIAISAFAVQEFVSKVGVTEQTPLFFKPLATTIHEFTNAGYIYH